MLITARFTQAQAKVRGAVLGSACSGWAAGGSAAASASLRLIPAHTAQGMTVDLATTPDARNGAPPRDSVPV